jgi:molybdate transport system regulatory protein
MGRAARGRVSARRPVPGRIDSKLRVWVVFGGRVKFGDGRAELLERVATLGSFKKAVEEVGMSYRGAWGYFRELERAAGVRFLERHPGGGPEGGTRLTAEGQRFLEQYRRFRRGVDAEATRRFRQCFGA